MELENIFKIFGFQPNEFWNDKLGVGYYPKKHLTDKAQYKDPLVFLNSEVEFPTILRKYIKDWRSGAEVRFKLPYYPDEKKQIAKSFNYI